MTALALRWFEDEDPRNLMRWAAAAAIVVAVHAGLITTYLLAHHPDEIGDDSSVVSVELAPIDSIADAVQRDVAPAPEDMVEQKATPIQPEKQPDQPKVDEPPPPDTTPSDVAILEPKPPEKVEEQKAPAPTTAARVTGGAPRVDPSWESGLVRHLQRFKRYPSAAQARNEQGVALLSFTVDRNGHVTAHNITSSSGHADLDGEVMAMIERAQPLPAFPASMTQPELSLTVPIRFSLH
jgi:protein TonB